MPLCIICETEKPDAEFKVRKGGVVSTECKECVIELRRNKQRNLAEQIINAPHQTAPEIRGSSEERLKQAIELRMEFYKGNALEALFDLALMPIAGANSATLQVKYLAACRLAGPAAEASASQASNPMESVLKQLNESYHSNAPRIREIRERVTVIENGPAPINGSTSLTTQ